MSELDELREQFSPWWQNRTQHNQVFDRVIREALKKAEMRGIKKCIEKLRNMKEGESLYPMTSFYAPLAADWLEEELLREDETL